MSVSHDVVFNSAYVHEYVCMCTHILVHSMYTKCTSMYLHMYNIIMHVNVLYMNIQVNSTANKVTATGCIQYVLCTITVTR